MDLISSEKEATGVWSSKDALFMFDIIRDIVIAAFRIKVQSNKKVKEIEKETEEAEQKEHSHTTQEKCEMRNLYIERQNTLVSWNHRVLELEGILEMAADKQRIKDIEQVEFRRQAENLI